MNDRNDSTLASSNERLSIFGTLIFGFGLVLVLARTIEATFGIPNMVRSWYQNDWLWWSVGFICVVAGARFLARSELQELTRTWRPSRPGKRFHTLVLYTRQGCHLCDEAAETLRRHIRWLPEPDLKDIDTDPTLVEKFGTCVPVVECDGRIRFRGKVEVTLLRRLIEGTVPNS